MRLLLVLSVALAAMLLTFGAAGSAQAHGGGHQMQIESADGIPADPASGQHRTCHCQGSVFCVQAIEAVQPVLLILDQPIRAGDVTFEPRQERSQSVLTDPPPPRA